MVTLFLITILLNLAVLTNVKNITAIEVHGKI